MIECLTSIAIGNPLIAKTLSGAADPTKPSLNGSVIAINPAMLGDADQMEADLEGLAKSITSLPKAEGIGQIFLPGERGSQITTRASRKGFPFQSL